MKLNVTLKVEAPPKPSTESFANGKKFYKDCEYYNSRCLMIMKNHMEESIYANTHKIENAKEVLDDINKKYTKFSKNGKNELFNNY